jgi:thioesterase domain-containing protein
VWGLQSPGLDDDDPVPESVGALADHFLELVTPHAAGRPLLVGGMSYGAFVAFEMAIRALESGTPVELVVLLDPVLRWVPALRLAPPRRSAARTARRTGRSLRLVLGGWLGLARRSLRELRGESNTVRAPADYRHFTRISRLHARALRRWHPRPYAGAVAFFRSGDQPEAALRRFLELCHGPLEVIAVAGSHLEILEPPRVAGLATALEARLEIAASARRSGSPASIGVEAVEPVACGRAES